MARKWISTPAALLIILITVACARSEPACLSNICVGDGIAEVPVSQLSPSSPHRQQDPADVVRRLLPIFPGASEADLEMLAHLDYLPAEWWQFDFVAPVKEFFNQQNRYCDFFGVLSRFKSASGYATEITMNPLTPSGPIVVTEIVRIYDVPPTEMPAFMSQILQTFPGITDRSPSKDQNFPGFYSTIRGPLEVHLYFPKFGVKAAAVAGVGSSAFGQGQAARFRGSPWCNAHPRLD